MTTTAATAPLPQHNTITNKGIPSHNKNRYTVNIPAERSRDQGVSLPVAANQALKVDNGPQPHQHSPHPHIKTYYVTYHQQRQQQHRKREEEGGHTTPDTPEVHRAAEAVLRGRVTSGVCRWQQQQSVRPQRRTAGASVPAAYDRDALRSPWDWGQWKAGRERGREGGEWGDLRPCHTAHGLTLRSATRRRSVNTACCFVIVHQPLTAIGTYLLFLQCSSFFLGL